MSEDAAVWLVCSLSVINVMYDITNCRLSMVLCSFVFSFILETSVHLLSTEVTIVSIVGVDVILLFFVVRAAPL